MDQLLSTAGSVRVCIIPTADSALEAGMVFHMHVSAMGLAFSETVAVTGAELSG